VRSTTAQVAARRSASTFVRRKRKFWKLARHLATRDVLEEMQKRMFYNFM